MATIQDAIEGTGPVVQNLGAAQLANKPMARQAYQDLADYGAHWRGQVGSFTPIPVATGDVDAYANSWNGVQAEARPGIIAAMNGVTGQAAAMPVAMQGSAADRANSYEGAWNEITPGKGPALNPDQSAAQSAAQGAGGATAVNMLDGAAAAKPQVITNTKSPVLDTGAAPAAAAIASQTGARWRENPAGDRWSAMPRTTVDEEDAYQSAVRNRDAATNSGGGD